MNLSNSFKFALWLSFFASLPVSVLPPLERKPINSEIKFKIFHYMHNAEGSSDQLSGVVRCESNDVCNYNFTIPATSFNSKNEDRDRDMKKTIRSDEFQKIKLFGTGKLSEGKFKTQMSIQFVGITIERPVEFNVDSGWFEKKVSGTVELKLSDFKIVLPTLLGTPIKDRLKIDISTTFKKQ
ncbi:MAG: YceI family protein [Bdellovibrionales bacterium]